MENELNEFKLPINNNLVHNKSNDSIYKNTITKNKQFNPSKNKRNSRSPNQLSKKTNNQIKKQKKRSPSPIYKCSSELLCNGTQNFKVIKKEINIIPATEENIKKIKDCEKQKLPKEKTFIIKESNYEKIMSLFRENKINKNQFIELNEKYEEQFKIKEEKISNLEKVNKAVTYRNNQLSLSLKNTKVKYDQLNIEMNKYESTFKKLIFLIKYILQLFPNNNNIQNKIIELQLEILLNNYDQDEIKVSDLMTEEQNERNKKLMETSNKLRDIEDMKELIENIKIDSSSDNLKQKLTEKMKRINELTEENEKLDNNYIEIKAKYNNLISENNEEIISLKKKIKIFETQISYLNKDKIKLKNEIDKLKEKIDNSEDKINNQSNNSNNNNNDNNNQKIEELTLITQDQENIINGNKIEIESLQKEKEKMNQLINKMEKQIEFLNKKISKYEPTNNSDNNNLSSNKNESEFNLLSINNIKNSKTSNEEKIDFNNKNMSEINITFPINNEETTINEVINGDLFLGLYNQSKLIEQIKEKNDNLNIENPYNYN